MRVLVSAFFLLFSLPVVAQDATQQMQLAAQQAFDQAQQAAQQAAQMAQQANDAIQAGNGWTSRPNFSLKGGSYKKALSVRMWDDTPHATIYYTTDGSTPTKHSAVYQQPIPVGATTRVRAMAVAPHRQGSLERSAEYRIATP